MSKKIELDEWKDLQKAIEEGEYEENLLTVEIDNDCIHVYYALDGEEDEPKAIFATDGPAHDIEEVLQLLLPEATVEWV